MGPKILKEDCIHYALIPHGVCKRKDANTERIGEQLDSRYRTFLSTNSAVKVTCTACRRWLEQRTFDPEL